MITFNGRISRPARALGLFSILSFLIVVAGLLLSSAKILQTTRELAQHTHDVIVAIDALETSRLGAETKQRGFLLTRDEKYLVDYDGEKAEGDAALETLKRAVPDEEGKRLLGLYGDIWRRKLAEMDATIAQMRRGDSTAAVSRVASNEGLGLGRKLHEIGDQLFAIENKIRQERINDANHEAREQAIVAVTSVLLALLALAFAVNTYRRMALAHDEAKLRLDEKARSLEVTLEHAMRGILLFDGAGRVREVNQQFSESLDVSPVIVRGMMIDDVVARLVGCGHSTAWLDIMNCRNREERDCREISHNGRTYDICINNVPRNDGFVVTLVDITDRREAEERLRQAQKMEVVGQLTGGIAHDFNNLLCVISGYLDFIGTRASDERTREYAKLAAEATDRGSTLTRQLLAFARKQPLRPATVPVNEMVKSAVEDVHMMMNTSIKLVYELDEHVWSCQADEESLRLALMNLLINARDALAEVPEGKIVIRTANATLLPSNKDPKRPVGDFVSISVTDNGAGMTPETKNHIFEPFFTTKPIGRGTGLGLSIVFGFVTQSGGAIDVSSQPSVGTTMRLYLPKATVNLAIRSAPSQTAKTSSGGQVILVVDDEEGLRDLASMALSDADFEVITCANAVSAMDVIKSGRPIDLVFTDIKMPGEHDGLDVAQLILKQRPETPVIVTSGIVDLQATGRCPSQYHTLKKPYRISEVVSLIKRLTGTHPDLERTPT